MWVYEGSGHEVFLPGERGELDGDKGEDERLLCDDEERRGEKKNSFETEMGRLRGSPSSSIREAQGGGARSHGREI
jgi:hypothetical protein